MEKITFRIVYGGAYKSIVTTDIRFKRLNTKPFLSIFLSREIMKISTELLKEGFQAVFVY